MDPATGKVGDFVALDDGLAGATGRVAVSPVFDSLNLLFDWMATNGWKFAEHEGQQFHPWRVRKTA
jgi:hypothetical protein